jgi:hypothetical protein
MSISVKSQELEVLLLAKSDANLLIKNFLEPVNEGMLFNLNNGWYHTAKTHKKFGFDITVNANASIVPSKSRSFEFIASEYQYLTLESGSSTINNAMGGKNNSKIGVRIPEAGNVKVAQFTMPNGIGDDLPFNAAPTPMIQASVGLFLDTDIAIRYLPKTNTNEFESNLFGFGIKHNLMQYFEPLDKLPLNISLFAGYTSMDTYYDLNAIPDLPGANQEAIFNLKAYTVQALASLDFPVVTLYGGIGFENGTSELKMKGTYELSYTLEGTNTTVSETITNPINMKFNIDGVRATAGVRLNLAFFKIFADYTMHEYNTISTGIAFSFR